MAENGPPPPKRMRYSLRSSIHSESIDTPSEPKASKRSVSVDGSASITRHQRQSTYKLRSSGKIDENEIQSIETLRKRAKKPSTLLTLNPDCMLKIFEYTSLVDICAMAETCTTFNAYAKYYFRLKHKNFDFASMLNGEFLNVSDATKLLRIFGDEIHALKISRDLFNGDDDYYDIDEDEISSELLWSVQDNCPENLKALTLDGIVFLPGMMEDLYTVLNSIETLTLDECFMYNVSWCDMANVKVLKLNEVAGFRPYFWQAAFDKLEAIEFNHMDIDTDNLTEFILTVPTLKRLSIVKCWSTSIKCFGVVKLLEHLEEFEYQLNHPIRLDEIHHRYMMDLVSLKKLKVLKLTCNKMSVQPLIEGFVKEKIAIEHLELADGVIDLATAKAIAQLNTIKVLKFNDMVGFNEFFLVLIANELNQLEEFHIKTAANISQFRIKEFVRTSSRLTDLNIDAKDFGLNIDTFRAILNAVQDRTDNNHLAIKIHGEGEQPDEQLPNEKCLQVNRFDRNTKHMFPLYAWSPDIDDIDDGFDTDEEFDIAFGGDFEDDSDDEF